MYRILRAYLCALLRCFEVISRPLMTSRVTDMKLATADTNAPIVTHEKIQYTNILSPLGRRCVIYRGGEDDHTLISS